MVKTLDSHYKAATIKSVTSRLRPEVKEEIRKLWKMADIMELDYVSLEGFLRAIIQPWERDKEVLKKQSWRLNEIHKIIVNQVPKEYAGQ